LRPALRRLKDVSEFAQRLRAREPQLRHPRAGTDGNIEHPERHFQSAASLDVFQTAVRYRMAVPYALGTYPNCPAIPRMPGITNLTEISNMVVLLLSCTTPNVITKVWRTRSSARKLIISVEMERCSGISV
jgi:hypothetical protein